MSLSRVIIYASFLSLTFVGEFSLGNPPAHYCWHLALGASNENLDQMIRQSSLNGSETEKVLWVGVLRAMAGESGNLKKSQISFSDLERALPDQASADVPVRAVKEAQQYIWRMIDRIRYDLSTISSRTGIPEGEIVEIFVNAAKERTKGNSFGFEGQLRQELVQLQDRHGSAFDKVLKRIFFLESPIDKLISMERDFSGTALEIISKYDDTGISELEHLKGYFIFWLLEAESPYHHL